MSLLLLSIACGGVPDIASTADSGEKVVHPGTLDPLLSRFYKPWKGDLLQIRQENRVVRALVMYSKTSFFVDLGKPRGLECELLHQYEAFLNRSQSGKRLQVAFIVVPVDDLIPALLEGRGDIAAATLTITRERQQLIDFTSPYIKDVREIVITSPEVTDIHLIRDLSGRTIHTVAGSSHVDHLKRLNRRLTSANLDPVKIVEVESYLGPEDLLEMVDSGIYDLTVIDHPIAEIWSKVFKNIVLRNDLVINDRGVLAWAVRKESPELLESLNIFMYENARQGTLMGNILFKRYFKNTRWVRNPLKGPERRKFEELSRYFKQYGELYDFDWIRIAALAFQESGLDQSAVSPKGAVGIMQILPATAAEPVINIPDVESEENNIHAGVKYLHYLRESFFNDPELTPFARMNFTLAAYNAGPGKIMRLRNRAASRGVNPNLWFNNVEQLALESIGRETVQYVANITKYYLAYKSIEMTHGGEVATQRLYP